MSAYFLPEQIKRLLSPIDPARVHEPAGAVLPTTHSTGSPTKIALATEDCLEWTGARTSAGYGVKRGQYVHRISYELHHGPVPEGLEVDHLCRNRACYNPLHLEAVTHQENMRRGFWGMKTHCPEGHPYEGDNLIVSSGWRGCRECKALHRNKTDKRYPKNVCTNGHPRGPESRLKSGHCRECNKIKQAAYKARKRQEARA